MAEDNRKRTISPLQTPYIKYRVQSKKFAGGFLLLYIYGKKQITNSKDAFLFRCDCEPKNCHEQFYLQDIPDEGQRAEQSKCCDDKDENKKSIFLLNYFTPSDMRP